MEFEIYDVKTNETIDINTHSYFKNYDVAINLEGDIYMLYYGEVACCVDKRLFDFRIKK